MHHHKPDPGREAAAAFLVTVLANNRHGRPRTCLGCGGAGEAGMWECSGRGPNLHAWCTACYAETGNGVLWQHRLSWDRLWRVATPAAAPPPVPGQIALELGA